MFSTDFHTSTYLVRTSFFFYGWVRTGLYWRSQVWQSTCIVHRTACFVLGTFSVWATRASMSEYIWGVRIPDAGRFEPLTPSQPERLDGASASDSLLDSESHQHPGAEPEPPWPPRPASHWNWQGTSLSLAAASEAPGICRIWYRICQIICKLIGIICIICKQLTNMQYMQNKMQKYMQKICKIKCRIWQYASKYVKKYKI